MQTRPGSDEEAGFPHVSTGRLPTPELVTALVAEAHARYKSNTEGKNSQVTRPWPEYRASSSACAWSTNRRQRLRGRGYGRVLDHERVEAVA
jgi:hypothetical protein